MYSPDHHLLRPQLSICLSSSEERWWIVWLYIRRPATVYSTPCTLAECSVSWDSQCYVYFNHVRSTGFVGANFNLANTHSLKSFWRGWTGVLYAMGHHALHNILQFLICRDDQNSLKTLKRSLCFDQKSGHPSANLNSCGSCQLVQWIGWNK